MSIKDTLSSLGNNNVVGRFIAHYETCIKSDKEQQKSLSDTPNYFAWLSVSSEHILYSLRMLLFWKTQDSEVFDLAYSKLIDRSFDEFAFNEEEKEKVLLFTRIRHLIVHKGYPNPHVAPSKNSRNISKGQKFNEEEIFRLSAKLRNPRNFDELNTKYKETISIILKKNEVKELSF